MVAAFRPGRIKEVILTKDASLGRALSELKKVKVTLTLDDRTEVKNPL